MSDDMTFKVIRGQRQGHGPIKYAKMAEIKVQQLYRCLHLQPYRFFPQLSAPLVEAIIKRSCPGSRGSAVPNWMVPLRRRVR